MMNNPPLYQEIAESIRMDILRGRLQPEDELPTVRQMAEKWQCAPGTVLRAYQQLAKQGLVVSRPGAGTQVTAALADSGLSPLRKARLANSAEAFLLEALSAGYTIDEISPAFQLALDRYRTLTETPTASIDNVIHFIGSHDPIISMLASYINEINPEHNLHVNFAGSLGGLIALARNEADIAGSHLWDEATNTYNIPFIQRLLPGQQVALVNLVQRHIGLIAATDNPHNIKGLQDLSRKNLRFINRQSGAGTRVWLDAHLAQNNIDTHAINGYPDEALTHTEIAEAISDGQADIGLGIKTVALAYGLHFIPLDTERYDLVIPQKNWGHPLIQSLLSTLENKNIKDKIEDMKGYDLSQTGHLQWVS